MISDDHFNLSKSQIMEFFLCLETVYISIQID